MNRIFFLLYANLIRDYLHPCERAINNSYQAHFNDIIAIGDDK